jgi:hypothetical protein
MTGSEVRQIARRLLDRSQLMQGEAITARVAGAKRAAHFLDALASGIREDALALARGFPAANDGGAPPDDEPPPFGPDEPTPGVPPRAA